MSYGLKNLPVLGISMLGIVQLNLSHICHMRKRTVSYFFIGYSESSRGFRFYCYSTRNIETGYAKFIEKIQNSGSQLHKDFIFEKEQIVIHMTTVQNDEVVVLAQHENTVVPL